jgi:LuxR family transcriptional regulator, quorum-sensing system regulator SolR
MTAWQSELFDRLRGAEAVQVREHVAHAARDIGFSWYEHSVWHSLPLTNPALHMRGNTPAAWLQRYSRQRYWAIDPLVSHARRSLEPLVWGDGVFAEHPTLRSDSVRHGRRYGWTMAALNPSGQRGFFTVCRDAPAVGADEAVALAPKFGWLVYLAHMFLAAEHTAGPLGHSGHSELTPREAEVLRWIGDGKSSAETARILGISMDTVNFHLRNAMDKLNVRTRTSAVVTALMQGQLMSA